VYRCLSIAVIVVLMSSTTASGDGIDGTEITETVSGLVVTAGAPGSLALSSEPGRPGGGATVYCSWYHFSVVFGEYLFNPIGDSIWPQAGSTYLLNCWSSSPATPLPGYPRITQFRGRDKIPGNAVSTADAAQFAINYLNFERPKIELSPRGEQVVGVPTWLAVTSRLQYDRASANAGPVWATVRASLRDITWDLGNGASRECTRDVSKVWNPANPQDQSSHCSYTYTNSGGSPFNVTVTVRWRIEQRTNVNPAWHRWGTITRSSSVSVPVTQLQSAIR